MKIYSKLRFTRSLVHPQVVSFTWLRLIFTYQCSKRTIPFIIKSLSKSIKKKHNYMLRFRFYVIYCKCIIVMNKFLYLKVCKLFFYLIGWTDLPGSSKFKVASLCSFYHRNDDIFDATTPFRSKSHIMCSLFF